MKRLLRLLVVPAVLALALTSLSCGGDDDDNPMNPGGGTADHTVTMQGGMNGTYSPNPLNMTVGQTVRWRNNDSMTHSATQTPNGFSVVVGSGATSSAITMSTAGTFNYICNQPGHVMSGQIVVAP